MTWRNKVTDKQIKTLQSVLIHIAQEEIPEKDINLWHSLQKNLSSSQLIKKRGTKMMFSRNSSKLKRNLSIRISVGVGLSLAIIAAVIFLTPERQVLAEAFKHLFMPFTADQFPKSSPGELIGPTEAPTFAVTLMPSSDHGAVATPGDSAGELVNESDDPCSIDPYGYACEVQHAENKAGFDALEFPSDPKNFIFEGVIKAEPGEIMMEYDVIGGGGFLYLSQGLGEFSSFTGLVPENDIEQVWVGTNRGEYVMGDWAIGGVYKEVTWVSCCRYRLRWTEGDRWFEIDKQASLGPVTNYMTREVMIEMGKNLVSHPVEATSPRMDHLSLAEASQQTTVPILSPSSIPQGFQFGYASYDKDLSKLVLKYYPNGDPMRGNAEMVIVETPLDKVNLAPGENGEELKGETVVIKDYPGIFFSSDPGNHILSWRTDTLKITLSVRSNQYYGAQFTKEQILEIARSMQ